jgi:membrane-bound lytic murein transglycosylase D
MAYRASWFPGRLALSLTLVLAIPGLSGAEASSAEPIVEHADLPPPSAEASGLSTSVEQRLDSVGSSSEGTPAAPLEMTIGGPILTDGLSAPEGVLGVKALVKGFPEYPVVSNDRIHYFLQRFTGTRREVIGLWLERSSRYLGMIRTILRKHGLPEDLAFTAMIESGFNPVAVSRAGAKGLWQFMTQTGRNYGLRVDQWVDERLDPEKSTVAAAAYFRDLYNQFGSWFLAQAAYNAGEVTVARAIRLTRTNDFWELARSRHLRAETKDFVPAIQAVTLIGREPDRYGFEIPPLEPPRFETVKVPPRTDLRRLSRIAGVLLETLNSLNPELWRNVTPPGGPWELKVPEGSRESVRNAVVAGKTSAPRTPAGKGKAIHIVRRHETVSGIARYYGVTVKDIVRWNRLASLDRIWPGDRLRIANIPSLAREEDEGGFR